MLGDDARLSPIDAGWSNESGRISATAIEQLSELADRIENEVASAAIIEHTIGRMEIEDIAMIYREGRAGDQHAKQLLEQHQLANVDDDTVKEVIEALTTNAPSHGWTIDYHLAKAMGLRVKRMSEARSDAAKALAKSICCEIETGNRSDCKTGASPYFLYVPLP